VPDLARDQLQPPAVECAAKRHRHEGVAVPTYLKHGGLEGCQFERGRKAFSGTTGVNDKIAFSGRRFGRGEIHAKPARQVRARGIDVDKRHLRTGHLSAQIGNQRAHHAGADNSDAAGRPWRSIPDHVERGLHIGGKHRALGRHAIGQGHDGARRDIKNALMRMESKYRAAEQACRPDLDGANGGVAVFDRKREAAAHERGAHTFEFAFGDTSAQDERLGAAAYRAEKGAHTHLILPRRGSLFLTNFGTPRTDVPKRLDKLFCPADCHFVDPELDYWDIASCYIVIARPNRLNIRSRNRVLERSRLQEVNDALAGTSLTGRRVLIGVLFATTMAGSLALMAVALSPGGFDIVDYAILALFAVTLPWMVAGFWNAAIGFLIMRFAPDPIAAVTPIAAGIRGNEPITASTAILICIRNELPERVIRNLEPTMNGLSAAGVGDRFHVYVLSDTNDAEVATIEEARFGALASRWRGRVALTYRRRAINTGYKAGNIRDFCERWGNEHEFAVTLDTDSFMTADAILRLVRIMQADPKLGILQGLVVGLPSTSAFARIFQFGMRLGMRSYTIGSAWWQGDCGPYWGHNAVLRLKPFMAHCELPVLAKNETSDVHILSHDQIEAVLMRRAGYDVRVLPEEELGWEENPPTLIEFIRRDLRWCQGNMQYWRFMTLPGLKAVSRYQLAIAILMFVGSPAWIGMLVLGTLSVAFAESPAAVIRPDTGLAVFILLLVMWFAPKIASVIDILSRRQARGTFGGTPRFVASVAIETVFFILLCPIMWFGHTIFLCGLLFGREIGWIEQTRDDHAVPFALALRNLWPHTLLGCGAIGVLALTHPEAIPYALFLVAGPALAIPFALATALPAVGSALTRIGIGRLPEETAPPAALSELALPAIEIAAPLPRPQPV
jgi:membrane glycosyltransferase